MGVRGLWVMVQPGLPVHEARHQGDERLTGVSPSISCLYLFFELESVKQSGNRKLVQVTTR